MDVGEVGVGVVTCRGGGALQLMRERVRAMVMGRSMRDAGIQVLL